MKSGEQELLKTVLRDECRYDPTDINQREFFLKVFDIKIFEEKDSIKGWSVLWKYGGGIVCPPMPEDDARSVIALACYLYLCGVDVSLTDHLAYWYIRGPKLRENVDDRCS